jgi:type I restriction-modification system DNA methylase subunit
MPALDKAKIGYSEQDTADKLILPFLASAHKFPSPDSLDYQAQHTLIIEPGKSGRYDGLFLSGGYPYAVLEAKKYSHDLAEEDEHQARDYATSPFFDKPVPFIIVSNGREHRFLKITATIDPADGKLTYNKIPGTNWANITSEQPGEVRRLLGAKELLDTLLEFKQSTYLDMCAIFKNSATGKFDLSSSHPLIRYLKQIIDDRKNYIGVATNSEQKNIEFALEAISLHFTTKILFIKLIEDLSSGPGTPRIIHTLFPREEYDLIGGLFGFKVLNAMSKKDSTRALRLYVKSRRFYRDMAKDIAKVTWQDIFRYGFNVHTDQYGKVFKAENYDRFLPSESTLANIRGKLINIDVRSAIIYRSSKDAGPENVIGHIYERLIDEELRNSIGAIYTPDATVTFMTELGRSFLGRFRSHKIVEPSCGSGHFYRKVYREYVDEVLADQEKASHASDPIAAHREALSHIYGRDIDPFAVQLTLLGTFLEQLRDNVRPAEKALRHKRWSADLAIDTQNSLDPITVNPDLYFDIEKTDDLHRAISRQRSCKRAEHPKLIIGNPPYGVKVVTGAHYDDIYDLQSKDSYGYFIVNAIRRLSEGSRVVFIVSSSFLTIQSHQKLRKFILDHTKIIRLVKLHRSTFPGIDIFPVIIELQRCEQIAERSNNVYHYYDLWQLHPATNEVDLRSAYGTILKDLAAKNAWPYDADRTARYTVRQGLISKFTRLPIFDALPSLFTFMQDVFEKAPATKKIASLDGSRNKEVPILPLRDREMIQLRNLADVKIGLQSGDNARFYRIRKGVTGGAVKGGYKTVDARNIATDKQLQKMSAIQRSDGIPVNDPTNDRYFVPLDKSGESDIEAGVLSMFYQPVDFYIDWSEGAVKAMKSLKGARFQNAESYFRRGISFSNTGIYSPTFRLSHGGVFDQKRSCIFSEFLEPEYLLGVLSSKLFKYFVKSFINHGLDAQLDDLPIAIATDDERAEVVAKVNEIVADQKKTQSTTSDHSSQS